MNHRYPQQLAHGPVTSRRPRPLGRGSLSRTSQRPVVVGIDADPIQETRSFCAPPASEPAHARGARVSNRSDASTQRGTPRPARITASVRQITGDYRKADDNELPRPRRHPSDFMQAVALVELDKEPQSAPADPSFERRVIRDAWLHGAAAGSLLIAVAYLAWIIAQGG